MVKNSDTGFSPTPLPKNCVTMDPGGYSTEEGSPRKQGHGIWWPVVSGVKMGDTTRLHIQCFSLELKIRESMDVPGKTRDPCQATLGLAISTSTPLRFLLGKVGGLDGTAHREGQQ